MIVGTPELAQLLLRIVVFGGGAFFLGFLFYDKARSRARKGLS